MKRRLIALVFAVVLLAVIAAGYWLLTTQSGLKTSLNIVQKAVSGLTIKEAKGRLYDGLVLRDIHYAPAEGPQIQIGEIDGQWQLWSIQSGRLMISQLHVSKLQISLP